MVEGPDGPTAWIVAFATFVINFIMAGIFRASGILFVAVMDTYGSNIKSASMPFTIKSSVRNLLGPAVGILGAKYGTPPVIIAGGMLGVTSAASCFYVTDVTSLIIVWGVISGASSALITVLPQVVIGQYFQKHRTTATGISCSGGSIASFIFPVVIERSLDRYGLEGTFVVIGAIIMHTIPAAMILKKPPWLKDNSVKNKNLPKPYLSLQTLSSDKTTNISTVQKVFEELKVENTYRYLTDNIKIEVNDQLQYLIKDINFSYLMENKDILRQLLSMGISTETEKAFDAKTGEEISNTSIIDYVINVIQNNGSDSNLAQHNIISLLPVSNANENFEISNLKQSVFKFSWWHKRSYELEDKKESHISTISKNKIPYPNLKHINIIIPILENICEKSKTEIATNFTKDNSIILKTFEELRKFYEACKIYINMKEVQQASVQVVSKENYYSSKMSSFNYIKIALKLHTNPIYILICLSRTIYTITFSYSLTIIVDFAMDQGLEEEDGKFIIAAIAFGDLLGRTCTGWITDRGFLKLHAYIIIVMIAQGFSTFSICFMSSRISFLIAVGFFALLQGSLFVRHPVLVMKYMDKEKQAVAMGSIDFFSSFIAFLLPLYIGFFRDTMGSYSYIMYINGSIGTLLGFLWTMEPYLNRKNTTTETNERKV